MNDAIERELVEWMQTVAASVRDIDPLRSLELPARRPRFGALTRLLTATASVAVVAVVAVILLGRTGLGHGIAAQPSLDPRLARCGASDAVTSFEMAHAADYQKHLPHMLLSPELDRPDPALVAIMSAPPLGLGRNGAQGSAGPLDPSGSLATVCVVVGADAATAEVNVYENVDITGLLMTP